MNSGEINFLLDANGSEQIKEHIKELFESIGQPIQEFMLTAPKDSGIPDEGEIVGFLFDSKDEAGVKVSIEVIGEPERVESETETIIKFRGRIRGPVTFTSGFMSEGHRE